MSNRFRFHIWLVDLISRIVPRRFRSDWKQEWKAELVHRESLLQQWRQSDWSARWDLLKRSLASFWDALAMQPRRLEEEVVQDLRYGIRMLLQSKGVTAVAILSLALGIGANTALFSLIDGILLRPLGVPNPEELVLFNWSASKSAAGPSGITFDGNRKDPATGVTTWDSFSYRAFEQFRKHNETLSSIFAFARVYRINVVAEGSAEIADGQLVSGGYFAGLGLNTVLGRTIQESDDQATAPLVTVMGYRYWQGRFGLDRAIIGRTINVNGVPLTVIGVAAPDFSGTLQVNDSPDLYMPMSVEPTLATYSNPVLKVHDHWWLQIMGRLKPGTSLKQVEANLAGVFQQTNLEMLGENSRPAELPRLEVVEGSHGLGSTRDEYTQSLMILIVIMGFVLLIACANVANLLLARATARQREIATRMSIGAARLRILRQLLTESVLLAVLGGMLGAMFAYWGKDLLLRWGPWSGEPGQIDIRMDLRVLGFTALISIVTGVLFGLAPAVRALRTDLAAAIIVNFRTPGASRSRISKSLLIVQVAMAVVLLVGAGLFVQTLRNLHTVDLGFDTNNLLLFRIDPALNRYQPEQFSSVVEQVIQRLEGIEGVRAATASHRTLVGEGANFLSSKGPDGVSVAATFLGTRFNFFETMGVPVTLGRSFRPEDARNAPGVAVINETLARRYFANSNPIGKKVWNREIVGVVRDRKQGNPRADLPPTIYTPYLQERPQRMTFAVRTSNDPALLIPSVREIAKQVDPNLPIHDIGTQKERIDRTFRRERLFANFATAFGGLALFLACVGLYGVMSYNVLRRTHEIGIRMALGAQRSTVRTLVLRETLSLVSVGIVMGLAAALALTTKIESILFGLEKPNDPTTFIAAAMLMFAVTAFAGYLPARRASRVDPLVAIRYE